MGALLIYDGECKFCRFGVHLIERVDRRRSLNFCPFGHPVAEGILSAVPEEIRYESMHLAVGDLVLSGTDAAREVLGVLPFGRLAVALGLHKTYPFIARNRWFFGRFSPHRVALETCGPPTERAHA